MEHELQTNLQTVQNIPFFSQYREGIQNKIAEKMCLMHFKKGDSIIQEGEFGEKLYVIKKGSARVSRQGKEIAILQSGDFFGELSLVTSDRCVADIKALDDLETVTLSKEDFLSLIKEGLFQDMETKEELYKRIRENYQRGF